MIEVIAAFIGRSMLIDRLNHLVLTVSDVNRTIAFYTQVLRMKAVTFGEGRHALAFGRSKLNLHQAGREFEPRAEHPTPGAADICLIAADSLEDVLTHLTAQGITIEEGPIRRTGALGPISSVYIRDPDGNLIEISNYVEPGPS